MGVFDGDPLGVNEGFLVGSLDSVGSCVGGDEGLPVEIIDGDLLGVNEGLAVIDG